MWLYNVDPVAPFLFTGILASVIFLMYTVGFCWRLGVVDDIEEAEEKRARRKGIKRVSSWKVSTRQTTVDRKTEGETVETS